MKGILNYKTLKVSLCLSTILICIYPLSVRAQPNIDLYKWTSSNFNGNLIAGIHQKDDDIDARYDGVVFRCVDGNIDLTVGAISTAHLAKLFMKEEIPKFKIVVDEKNFEFENPIIEHDEHDNIWNYRITNFNGLDFTSAMSKAKSMSIVGHGIEYKLPLDGQASLARFGNACRVIQEAKKLCKLERVLTGSRNVAALQNHVSGSKAAYTTFVLRGADRDERGVLRSEIVGELTPSRVGYEVSSPDGEKLGLLEFGESIMDNFSKEQCPKLATKRDGPGRLAILKGGQQIGVIIDERRVLGRSKS